MKPAISILMPAIRKERWPSVYDSIAAATSRKWELVIASPYTGSLGLAIIPNVTWIRGWQSPVVRHQRAFIASQGDVVTWFADDGLFHPGVIDRALDIVRPGTAVFCRYTEGDHSQREFAENQRQMHDTPYWRVKSHGLSSDLKSIPDDCLHGMTFVHRDDAMIIGGWDCGFETPGIAYLDFGIRLHRSGCKLILMDGIGANFTLMEGPSGDHGPIHYACLEHDQPRFREIYSQPEPRISVPLDNWKDQPARWERGFPARWERGFGKE